MKQYEKIMEEDYEEEEYDYDDEDDGVNEDF